MDFDFIIIGSGLAGLYSAYIASKFGTVALITKTSLQNSNSYWAQGGIAAVVDPDDSIDLHIKDTLEAGRDLCDLSAVKVLVQEGSKRIKDLIELGAPFDLDNGNISLGLEGGHSWRRILHSGGDATGKNITQFLIDLISQNENISLYQYAVVYKLLSEDERCYGVGLFSYELNRAINLSAHSTILASGGAASVYNRTTNPPTTTGDGIALAFLAGADIANLEFMQFHPSAFYAEGKDASLISEAVRGEGAHLLNIEHERFMVDIHELAELAPRDIVSAAIFNEMKRTGSDFVYLSLKHLDAEKIYSRFKTIAQMLKDHNLDIAKDLIPIAPAAHYTVGGVKTDLNGLTSLKGLYAVGEVSSTGVHGANRLASNSLLECLVFSKRAVEHALSCDKLSVTPDFPYDNLEINSNNDLRFTKYFKELSYYMDKYVGIVRNNKSLSTAFSKIKEIENIADYSKKDINSYRFRFNLTIQKIITAAAIKRKETRGGHRRDDFTKIDPDLKGSYIFNFKTGPRFVKLTK